MVKHEWIVDDNAENIIPVFYDYQYDKTNPGVYIEILKENSLKDGRRKTTRKSETDSNSNESKRSRSK